MLAKHVRDDWKRPKHPNRHPPRAETDPDGSVRKSVQSETSPHNPHSNPGPQHPNKMKRMNNPKIVWNYPNHYSMRCCLNQIPHLHRLLRIKRKRRRLSWIKILGLGRRNLLKWGYFLLMLLIGGLWRLWRVREGMGAWMSSGWDWTGWTDWMDCSSGQSWTVFLQKLYWVLWRCYPDVLLDTVTSLQTLLLGLNGSAVLIINLSTMCRELIMYVW